MSTFAYRAVAADGHIVQGVMQALDEDELEARLEEAGLWLVEAKPAERKSKRLRFRIKDQDWIELAAEIAPLLRAGVPLVEALQAVARNRPEGDVRTLVEAIERAIRAGESLSSALQEHDDALAPHLRAVLAAGERSGELATAFDEVRRYLEWTKRLRSQIRQASLYPIFVAVAVFSFIVLLFSFVVPRFARILGELGLGLPWPTQLVMALGNWMQQAWPIVMGVPLAIAVGVVALHRRSLRAREWLDDVRLRLPVIGSLQRMLLMARFSRHLGLLYRAGIPLVEILDALPALLGNAAMARAVVQMRDAVLEGASLSEAMRRCALFPPFVVQMVAVGEQGGRLDEALLHVSSFYDEEIPRRIAQLFGVVEPVITLLLVGVVGFVALSLFLPLVQMIGGLR